MSPHPAHASDGDELRARHYLRRLHARPFGRQEPPMHEPGPPSPANSHPGTPRYRQAIPARGKAGATVIRPAAHKESVAAAVRRERRKSQTKDGYA